MTWRVLTSRETAVLGGVLALLNDGSPQLAGLFRTDRELTLCRAPGRLDVMGGIADYSGSLVLQWPLREACWAAVQQADAAGVRILSLPLLDCGEGQVAVERESILDIPFSLLFPGGEPLSYETARKLFAVDPRTGWGAYVAGALLVLARERGVRFSRGCSILIASSVPEGKGVASSAALEVAAMSAIAAAFDVALAAEELARLCQLVEQQIAGAACGIMDQMTAVLGQEDRLLALLCQPAEVRGNLRVPDGLAFFGLDSGLRHSVAGADYGSVRAAAFMGYRILADRVGLTARSLEESGRVRIDDERWHGYLANVDPAEFEASWSQELPESMNGGEFLQRFGGTTDPVARIDPEQSYPVRAATAHPVFENARVREFAELLEGPPGEGVARRMGELMIASHRSYSACGLGSGGTDLLVELVERVGRSKGLFGARITGGGSGGSVAILGRSDAGLAVEEVARLYSEGTGHQPILLRGSSPGSAAWGTVVLECYDAGP